MTKTRSELWRGEREKMLRDYLRGSELIEALGIRLERVRDTMHTGLGIEKPAKYASSSVDNIKRLCEDIDTLTIALVLRARGLTNEADQVLAEGLVIEIEEDMFGYAPNARGH